MVSLFALRPSFYFIKLSDIPIPWFQEKGVQGIILDLDNTIVSEDDRYLSPNVEAWLSQVKKNNIQIFLVSNGKRKRRFMYWMERFNLPGIYKARKPFKTGFRRALQAMNLKSDQVIVIGDSMHTDIIGAKLSKLASIQVSTLPHPKRWWEKILGNYVQIQYPQDYPLDYHQGLES